MMYHRRWVGVGLAVVIPALFVATTSLATTRGNAASSTTSASAPSSRAIWPVAPTMSGYASPVAAARGFAVSLLHMRAPVVGPYSSRSATTGVIGVRYAARRDVTNVHVERFNGMTGWWVVSATTAQIDLISPIAFSHVSSPLTLKGTSLAFEAVVNISLYVDGRRTALLSSSTMGGSTQMAPFLVTLHFPNGLHRDGTLVMYTRSPKDGSTVVATARRLMFK